MPADPNQVIANLRELAALTSDDHGAQRIAFTATWQKARDWFASKLRGLYYKLYQLQYRDQELGEPAASANIA